MAWRGWLLAAALLAAPYAAHAGWPFFALCMDTHDAKKRNLPEQAQMLKELGYDGAGHLWLTGLAERLSTLDAVGLRLFQVYLNVDLAPDAKEPYDAKLCQALPLLFQLLDFAAQLCAWCFTRTSTTGWRRWTTALGWRRRPTARMWA